MTASEQPPANQRRTQMLKILSSRFDKGDVAFIIVAGAMVGLWDFAVCWPLLIVFNRCRS
jgi:hypothetical protein